MKKVKVYSYNALLKKELTKQNFRQEYEQLENEFTLAKEIIKLRQQKQLTQKELASIVGTSQPSIARIESGNYQNISLSFLRRLAMALDVSAEIRFKKIAR